MQAMLINRVNVLWRQKNIDFYWQFIGQVV